MNPKLLTILIIIFFGGILVLRDQFLTPEIKSVLPEFEDAPNFKFRSIEGKLYELNDFKGNKILLNFWASWCLPCKKEFPFLLKIAQEEELTLIAISVDRNIEDIKSFLKTLDPESGENLNKGNIFISHDPAKEISEKIFKTYKFPESFIIDEDLKIRKKIAGEFTESHLEFL